MTVARPACLACLVGMGWKGEGRQPWGEGREGWEGGLAAGWLAGWGKKNPLGEGGSRERGEGVGVGGAQRRMWGNRQR